MKQDPGSLLIRIVVGLVAIAIGVNGALRVIRSVAGTEPTGPVSSSYATVPAGAAAYADLLAATGHRVERLRVAVRDADLDPAHTVVLLDAGSLTDDDQRVLRGFLGAGGRLVAGGTRPALWLMPIVGSVPSWSDAVTAPHDSLVPAPETAGVTQVVAERGVFVREGPALPLIGGPDGSLLVRMSVGRGTALLLADASPLQNRLLATADNAALGIGLAGPSERPVVFVESVHGFTDGGGLSAVPFAGRMAGAGLLVAGAVFVWSRMRRFGDVEDAGEMGHPPRREYVEAMSGHLRRRADAAPLLREAALHALVSRTGTAPDAPAETIRRAAAEAGLSPAEADALAAQEPGTAERTLVLGRALAALHGGRNAG